jgi:hypothetical protein
VTLRPAIAPHVTTFSVLLTSDADPIQQLSLIAVAFPMLTSLTVDCTLAYGHKHIYWSGVLAWVEQRELPQLAWFSFKRYGKQQEETLTRLKQLRDRAEQTQVATGVHCVFLHGAADWLSSLPVEERASKRQKSVMM